MVDTKTITEDTSEYVYTFDSEKYDDVLVVGNNLSGTQNVNTQIRFKLGSNFLAVPGTSQSVSAGNVNVLYKYFREKNDLYYVYNTKDSVTNIATQFITNQNYIDKKINSVRIVAQKLTSGTFKIYAKVRSEFL